MTLSKNNPWKPVVLVFSGHDPSGGAGIQADIESITNNGCHCVSVITATTAQNTIKFDQLFPHDVHQFKLQTQSLISDLDVHAVKIGLTGSEAIILTIADLLRSIGNIPIILDPVLSAGTGKQLLNKSMQLALIEHLFPVTTILTPNIQEAYALTDTDNIHSAAEKIISSGCKNILITGADSNTAKVNNILFSNNQAVRTYEWERLPHKYHGSGCTLSSSIAANVAKGLDVQMAVEKAQQYTWQTLKHGRKLGKGQMHPDRLFRTYDNTKQNE